MSCRESAQGSLATTTAGRLFGLPDAQCTSIFHQLRGRYDQAYQNLSPEQRSTEDMYRHDLYEESLEATGQIVARSGLWTERTRAAAARRVQHARSDTTVEPRHEYALTLMPEAASTARALQDTYLADQGHLRGMTQAEMANEYHRLRSEYDRSMASHLAAMETPHELMGVSEDEVLPNDPATRWALGVISEGRRCAVCQQFISPNGHNCQGQFSRIAFTRRNRDGWAPLPAESIDAQTLPLINLGTAPTVLQTLNGGAFDVGSRARPPSSTRRGTASAATPPDAAPTVDGSIPSASAASNENAAQEAHMAEQMGEAPLYPQLDSTRPVGRCPDCGRFRGLYTHTCRDARPEGVERQPDTVDRFQETYDAARSAVQRGEPVPADTTLEQIPGAVTGGLGARDGGNSFGLELEIDFPDDTYPFPKRQQFTRRLYDAGIVRFPDVQRWHSVGDEDSGRPNGTYQHSSDGWVCEYDRSVDDEGGMRGVEIKSQIMYDEPETWQNLRTILAVAEELGGQATHRTGMHVNIGAHPMEHGRVEPLLNLMRTAAAYDDALIRLGNNPATGGGRHRGRTYCTPVIDNYSQVTAAENAVSGYASSEAHRQSVNLSHVTPAYRGRHRTSSRVEFREFDGVAAQADIGRIQAAVTLHLSMVQAAADGQEPGQDAQPAGTQRRQFGRRTLTGEQWDASTLPMRNLLALTDDVAPNPLLRRQLVHMFTESRWQTA